MQRENLLKRAMIPVNHWDCNLAEIPDDFPYKKRIIQYIENLREHIDRGEGLWLWGDYGTGKTGIAAILAKAALNKGYMPCWIAAENIPAYMCEDIYFSDDLLMRDRIFQVPMLVIDDIRLREQKNLRSDWIERWLEGIIRRRRDALLVTICSSNNSPFELKKLKAVYAISQEAMEFIEVKGKNFREA